MITVIIFDCTHIKCVIRTVSSNKIRCVCVCIYFITNLNYCNCNTSNLFNDCNHKLFNSKSCNFDIKWNIDNICLVQIFCQRKAAE